MIIRLSRLRVKKMTDIGLLTIVIIVCALFFAGFLGYRQGRAS